MLIDLTLARSEVQLLLEVLSRAREPGGQIWDEAKQEGMRALSAKIGQRLQALEALEVQDGRGQAGGQ